MAAKPEDHSTHTCVDEFDTRIRSAMATILKKWRDNRTCKEIKQLNNFGISRACEILEKTANDAEDLE